MDVVHSYDEDDLCSTLNALASRLYIYGYRLIVDGNTIKITNGNKYDIIYNCNKLRKKK